MSITVRDVLELPSLTSAVVVGGQGGLDNHVRWAHVTELLDIARLLKGGELLLTTGLAIGGRPDNQEQYLSDLHARGVAGIVIELGRSFREIPRTMALQADRLSLPLIALTQETRFVQVTEEVHSLIISRHYAQLKRAEEVAGTFTSIAMNQEGIPEILRALSRVVENPVYCQPRDPSELPSGCPTDLPGKVTIVDRETAAAGRPSHGVVDLAGRRIPALFLSIALAGENWGDLIVLEQRRPLREIDLLVVDRAAVAIAYELLRLRSVKQSLQAAAGELLDDLGAGLLDDPEAFLGRARTAGVELAGRWSIAGLIAISEGLREDQVIQGFRRVGLTCLVSRQGGHLRVLVADSDQEDLPVRFKRGLAAAGVAAHRAAFGRPTKDPAQLRWSMERAGWALLIQNRYPEAGYGPFFDSMGAYRVLLGATDPEEVSRLIRDEIGPLLQPAGPGNGELLRTLRILLDESLSATAAARRLGLSRQALYQRIARIEEILGTGLQDPERRLSLALALRAYEIEELKKGNFTASSKTSCTMYAPPPVR